MYEVEKQYRRRIVLERKMQENTIGTLQVYGKKRKLPTLKITKFKGSITDWVRFWQWKHVLITNFTYLCKLIMNLKKPETLG